MMLRAVTLIVVLVGGAMIPAPLAAQAGATEPSGPDTVVFNASRGPVTFAHREHGERAECTACHHESRPEKPLTAVREKCSACHTNPATEPMKTSRRNAMHDTANRQGTCYNCHIKLAEEGKVTPSKCADCHKQEG